MGTKYTTTSSSGYNSSPPPDDGSPIPSNEITWATIKTKLPDPLKTFIETINTKLVTHFDESVLDTAIARTTVAADHKRTINVTAAATQSLGDATTLGVGYIVTIKNSHTSPITVDLATGADTLDGVAGGSALLEPGESRTFRTNAAANGFLTEAQFDLPGIGAAIASAAALPTPTTKYAHVTGTTDITSIATSGKVGTTIQREFDAVLTLTHHATDLILPANANITTAAGDVGEFQEYASGDWKLIDYQRASGLAVVGTPAVLIESQTASASSVLDFVTGIDSTYDHYELHLINVLPATDGALLRLRTSSNGGSSFNSGGIDYSSEGTGDHIKVCYSRAGSLEYDIANVAAQGGVNGIVHMYSPAASGIHTAFSSDGVCSRDTGNAAVRFDGAGSRLAAEANDAIRLFFSSGNIASGTVRLYGIP